MGLAAQARFSDSEAKVRRRILPKGIHDLAHVCLLFVPKFV